MINLRSCDFKSHKVRKHNTMWFLTCYWSRVMGTLRLEDRLDSLSPCLEEGGMVSNFP